MTRFKSKKNCVYLSDGTVKKTVSSAAAANFEADFLRALYAGGVRPRKNSDGVLSGCAESASVARYAQSGVAVPEVLEVCGNTLCLQYIPGDTLPDFLAKNPCEAELTAAAEGLAVWLKGFYQCGVRSEELGVIRGDVNGRNFIIYNGKWYGVDFEEYSYGAKEEDAGRLLAFADTYNLPRRDIQEFFVQALKKELIERLEFDDRLVECFFEKELEAMRLRRN